MKKGKCLSFPGSHWGASSYSFEYNARVCWPLSKDKRCCKCSGKQPTVTSFFLLLHIHHIHCQGLCWLHKHWQNVLCCFTCLLPQTARHCILWLLLQPSGTKTEDLYKWQWWWLPPCIQLQEVQQSWIAMSSNHSPFQLLSATLQLGKWFGWNGCLPPGDMPWVMTGNSSLPGPDRSWCMLWFTRSWHLLWLAIVREHCILRHANLPLKYSVDEAWGRSPIKLATSDCLSQSS